MNGVSTHEYQALELLDVVDFKWLMAHEGHHIQVERLETDRNYACQCFALAAVSPVAALQRAARRLAAQLGLATAQG